MINKFLVAVKLVYGLKTIRLNSEAIFVLKKLYERKFLVKARMFSVIEQVIMPKFLSASRRAENYHLYSRTL